MISFKHQSSKIFNLFTGLILSLLCILLGKLTEIDFHKIELPKDKPEFFATGIVANLFDAHGDALYKISAESGTEFPDSSTIHLQQIKFEAFDESTNLITQQLTSKNGWVDTQKSLAFLGESVNITSFDKDPKQNIYIYTRDVTIDSVNKMATTSAPIRATQGSSVLTGIGVKLDYDKQIITIESNVKVVYVPKK